MKISDKLYAAIKTALITFVSLLSVHLLGLVTDVMEWAGNDGADFPSITPLAKAVVAAFVATVVGLVNYVVNLGQEKGIVPGKAPSYGPTTDGE